MDKLVTRIYVLVMINIDTQCKFKYNIYDTNTLDVANSWFIQMTF